LSADVPIVVLSGGLVPLIEATLERFLGNEIRGIEVVANEVTLREGFGSIDQDGGSWKVRFRDDTVYGHDKAQAIKQYVEDREGMEEEEKPILLFAGDGISALGAAGHSDLLFAKQGEGVCLPEPPWWWIVWIATSQR
jgi:2-hydroxy-3-keto-5-methylthiopentenyl-1-phosphate phosphatase